MTEQSPIPTTEDVNEIDLKAAKEAGISEERLTKVIRKNPLPADILAISRGHRLLASLDPKIAASVSKYLYESFGKIDPAAHHSA